MKGVDQQSIEDLEFSSIKTIIASYCYGDFAKFLAHKIQPCENYQDALQELQINDDFFQIKNETSGFPRIEYDDLKPTFRFLKTSGGTLTLENIVKIYRASLLVNEVFGFFKNVKEDYSAFYSTLDEVYPTNEISEPIEKILDNRFKVKDDASKGLLKVRRSITEIRKKININFDRVLKKYQSKNLMGDTPEHYIRNRRVLAVNSSYKRSVNGTVVGSSKTGQLTYIEPKENEALNYELEMLEDDERNEINKIFQELTSVLSSHFNLIKGYAKVLTKIDLIQAKTRLAQQLQCSTPKFIKERHIQLIKARHPLLYLNHLEEKRPTYAQNIELNKNARMLIISGPNAGGKSITLKTVGLIQLMIQSGMMVPVDSNSKIGWFTQIYSDIGDNQSIQNHLSTYSYRLKRMNLFLNQSNQHTLLLLDEFGTGSDPELGGALAEVFFEQLYEQEVFAVITTHYSNIKLKASELNAALNACMLFDENTLQPLFKLSIGHPGSSFTFEVAQQNGIPKHLIKKARNKLQEHQVNTDHLITQLQHEKVFYQRKIKDLKEAEKETKNTRILYETSREDYELKYEKQQSFLEQNNRFVNYGKKLAQFIDRFKGKGKKEPVMGEIKKFLTQEKAKIEGKEQKEQVKKQKSKKKPTPQTRKNSKKNKPIHIGSLVKMHGSKVKGEVIELDNEKATVLFGNIKMTVSKDKIWRI